MKEPLNAKNIKDWVGKEIILETAQSGDPIITDSGISIPIDKFRKPASLIEIIEQTSEGHAKKAKIIIDNQEVIVTLNKFSGIYSGE